MSPGFKAGMCSSMDIKQIVNQPILQKDLHDEEAHCIF